MMERKNKILLFIVISLLASNIFILLKNPDCPFHIDYAKYAQDVNEFYEKNIIVSHVNNKYIYTYLMALILFPFKQFGIYNGMVFVTGLFQALLVFLFYKYTQSILKTILASTTLTFLTFIGHAETAILGSVFLLLYFINREKPYSEFFIMIAAFIRIDYAIYYLFARKKTFILPAAITFLQWFNGKNYIHSDFGFNTHPFMMFFFVFLFSYGFYFLLFPMLAKPKNYLDSFSHIAIILFSIIYLTFPTQKVFFFPVMLSFMLYDFDFRKSEKGMKKIIIILIAFNLILAGAIQISRSNICSAKEFYEFGSKYKENIQFIVFQPYLDYYGKEGSKPYTYQIILGKSQCSNATDYFIAEDWRNSQLLYLPYKFCLEPYDGKYE